jgi:hypothetical protein
MMERALTKEFASQLNRVDGIIGRYASTDLVLNESKATLPFDENTLIPPQADDALRAATVPVLLEAIRTVWERLDGLGLFERVAFDAELPAVQQVLFEASERVSGFINANTRKTLNALLQEGIDSGYSLQQIAKGVPADGYPGIRQAVVESYKNRPLTIARTEIRIAQNKAAIARYRAAGLQEVDVDDGDLDGPCQAANGDRWGLDYADANPVSHPNCTRGFTPVTENE